MVGETGSEIGPLDPGEAFSGAKHRDQLELATGLSRLGGREMGPGGGQQLVCDRASGSVAGAHLDRAGGEFMTSRASARLALVREAAASGLFFSDKRAGDRARRQRHAEAQAEHNFLRAVAEVGAHLFALGKNTKTKVLPAASPREADFGVGGVQPGFGQSDFGAKPGRRQSRVVGRERKVEIDGKSLRRIAPEQGGERRRRGRPSRSGKGDAEFSFAGREFRLGGLKGSHLPGARLHGPGDGELTCQPRLFLSELLLGLGGRESQHGQADTGKHDPFGQNDLAAGQEQAFGGDAAFQPKTRGPGKGLRDTDLNAPAPLPPEGDFGLELWIGQTFEPRGACLGLDDQLAGGREIRMVLQRKPRGGLGGEGPGDGQRREQDRQGKDTGKIHGGRT